MIHKHNTAVGVNKSASLYGESTQQRFPGSNGMKNIRTIYKAIATWKAHM